MAESSAGLETGRANSADQLAAVLKPPTAGSSTGIGAGWVIALTVVVGWLPMAILSLLTDSFWPQSSVPFPFTLNVSVLIGDSILLPIFNGFCWRLALASREVIPRWRPLVVAATAGFGLVSLAAQYLIHWSWTQDRWTGFMDLQPGSLSPAGWWHVAFAAVETTLMLMFLLLWVIVGRQSERARILAARGWTTVLIYFGLGIGDYLVQLATAYRQMPLLDSLCLQWPILLKLVVAAAVSFWARRVAAGR